MKNSAPLMDFETFRAQVSPVFIFGANRGGTTLAYHVSDFHTRIVKLPENTYFFKHYWNIRKHVPLKALQKVLIYSAGLQVPFSSTLGERTVSDEELVGRIINIAREEDPAKMFSYLAYAEYCRKAPSMQEPPLWWSERTNNHLFQYRTLKAWFPKSRFIFCVRDPRAVIASEIGALNKNKVQLPSRLNYCLVAALRWVRINSTGFAIQKEFPDDVIINRYEDLVSDTAAQANRFWEFLGLPQMSVEEVQAKSDAMGEIYVSKVGVDRKSGIDTKSIDRWRSKLSPAEVAMIETVTRKTAERLGFVWEPRPEKIFFGKRQPEDTAKTHLKRLAMLPLLAIDSPALFLAAEKAVQMVGRFK